MKVLLSIKPEFADKIFSGEKKYEYRKVIFAQKGVKTIVVYSTMPIGKIIGEFEIEEILQSDPSSIWKETKDFSGIKSSFFNEYFHGRSVAYAIKVKNATLYSEPIIPTDIIDNFFAPQSFRYLHAYNQLEIAY